METFSASDSELNLGTPWCSGVWMGVGFALRDSAGGSGGGGLRDEIWGGCSYLSRKPTPSRDHGIGTLPGGAEVGGRAVSQGKARGGWCQDQSAQEAKDVAPEGGLDCLGPGLLESWSPSVSLASLMSRSSAKWGWGTWRQS